MGTLRRWVGRGMMATVVVCAWPGMAGAQLRGASSAARGGSSSSERSGGGSSRVEHHGSSSSSSSSRSDPSPSQDDSRSFPQPTWGGASPTRESAWPPPRRATQVPRREEARRPPPPRFDPRPVRGPRRSWTQLEGQQPWSRVPPRAPDRDLERRRLLELERRGAVPPIEINIHDRRPPAQAPRDDEEDEEEEEDRRGMLRPENGGRLVLRRASWAVRSGGGIDPSCPAPRPYWGPRASAAEEAVEERALSAQLHLDVGWAVPGAGRAELGGRLLLTDGWNLEAAYSLYAEPTEDQGVLVLALGRAGVSHRVAEDRAISVRLGGALRHMQDWIGPAFGADVTLGVDMLLGDSVVLSAEAFAGVVGAAWLLQARASLGFLIDIVELRLGYDHVVLEPIAGGPGGMLTGPFLGARLWL